MRRRPSLTPCSRAAGKPALSRSSDELLINLLIRLSYGNAGIAQLVEQLRCNQQVVGSNPTAGSLVNCSFLGGCRGIVAVMSPLCASFLHAAISVVNFRF